MDLKRHVPRCLQAGANGNTAEVFNSSETPLLRSSLFRRIPSPLNNERHIPMDLHHPILREFPEYRDTIRWLKSSNAHFRNLYDEYHRIDDEIYGLTRLFSRF